MQKLIQLIMTKQHPEVILEKARSMKNNMQLSEREYKIVLAVYM